MRLNSAGSRNLYLKIPDFQVERDLNHGFQAGWDRHRIEIRSVQRAIAGRARFPIAHDAQVVAFGVAGFKGGVGLIQVRRKEAVVFFLVNGSSSKLDIEQVLIRRLFYLYNFCIGIITS